MSSADTKGLPVILARAFALAAWTWVVFAALGAWAITTSTADLPSEIKNREGVLDTFGEAFGSILTFDFGTSFWAEEPAREVALGGLGATLVVLVGALAITAILAAGLVALSRRSDVGRRVTTVLGYAGGLPAATWLLAVFWLDKNLWPSLVPFVPTSPVEYWPAALALAIPLAAVVARAVVHSGPNRDWVLDGWLFTTWLLGSVILVETVVGIDGVGGRMFDAVETRDPQLLVASAALLTVLALLASFVREVAWATRGAHTLPIGEHVDDGVETDGGAGGATPTRVVRERRRVRAGLLGIGVLLVVGVVGDALVDPAGGAPFAQRGLLELTLVGLADTVPTALWAGAVAVVVGISIGIVSVRVPYGRPVVDLLVTWAMNVPLVVLFWLVVSAPSWPSASTIMGLAVAPVVGMAASRDLRGGAPLSVAVLLPSIGVGAIGAGVVSLVYAQPGMLGVFRNSGLVLLTGAEPGGSLLRILLAVGLPAVSLFLLGDGLRRT